MRDPGRQFVPMQRALAGSDRLNEYIEHNGSAVFACPPGLEDGEHWGQSLFR
jgi:deferrochelatase/peroxidase EfeB